MTSIQIACSIFRFVTVLRKVSRFWFSSRGVLWAFSIPLKTSFWCVSRMFVWFKNRNCPQEGERDDHNKSLPSSRSACLSKWSNNKVTILIRRSLFISLTGPRPHVKIYPVESVSLSPQRSAICKSTERLQDHIFGNDLCLYLTIWSFINVLSVSWMYLSCFCYTVAVRCHNWSNQGIDWLGTRPRFPMASTENRW